MKRSSFIFFALAFRDFISKRYRHVIVRLVRPVICRVKFPSAMQASKSGKPKIVSCTFNGKVFNKYSARNATKAIL